MDTDAAPPVQGENDDLDALRRELEQLEQMPLADRPRWFDQVHKRLVSALRTVEEA